MHRIGLLLLLASCARPPPEPERTPERARPPPLREEDPLIKVVKATILEGDLAGARGVLERDRWLARDPARAALLYFDLLLMAGAHADAVEQLRDYVEKRTRPAEGRSAIAVKILRHHASGGGLRADGAEEACHFGLYALHALHEPETARPDLERAAAGAEEPERTLALRALQDCSR